MNRVNIAGYLSDDPKQLNSSLDSSSIGSRFSVAIKDLKNNNDTYFINCIAWAQTANYVLRYLKRGDFVVIDGRIVVRKYLNTEGRNISITQVVVDTIRSGTRRSEKELNFNDITSKISNNKRMSNNTQNIDEAFPDTVDLNLDEAFDSKEIDDVNDEEIDDLSDSVSWSDDLEE